LERLLAQLPPGYAMLLIVLVLSPVAFLLVELLGLGAVDCLEPQLARLFSDGGASGPECRILGKKPVECFNGLLFRHSLLAPQARSEQRVRRASNEERKAKSPPIHPGWALEGKR
jgi:hypothetical protein